MTTAPVLNFTGAPLISSSDLESDGFGFAWGITRSWTGLTNYSPVGNGWAITQLPYLLPGGLAADATDPMPSQAENGTYPDMHISVVDGEDAFTFATPASSATTTYAPWGGQPIGATLTYDPDSHLFTFTDQAGNKTVFYDVDRDSTTGDPLIGSYPSAFSGKFKSYTTADGSVSVTTDYDTDGNLLTMTRSDSTTGQSEEWDFTYSTITNDLVTAASGTAPELATNIAWKQDGTVIHQAVYDYYTGRLSDGMGGYVDDPNGRLGDLRTVTIEDGSGNVISQDYYRYYKFTGESYYTGDQGPTNVSGTTGGPDPLQPSEVYSYDPGSPAWTDALLSSGLKTVVQGASFSRMAAAVSNYQTASDADLQPYVDNYFQYERWSDHEGADGAPTDGAPGYESINGYNWRIGFRFGTQYRVTEEIAQGAGCSSCSGGEGTYKYEYTANYEVTQYTDLSDGEGDGVIDYNTWRMKQTVFLPDDTSDTWADNDREVIYTDQVGLPLLDVQVQVAPTPITITAVSNEDQNVMEVTAPDNGLSTGQTVALTGVLPEQFDGIFTVTVVDADHFDVTIPLDYAPPVGAPAYVNSDWNGDAYAAVVTSQQATYYRYDDEGRLIEEASPSAVTNYDESQLDLVDAMDPNGNIVPMGLISPNAGQVQTAVYSGWAFDGQAGIAANGSDMVSGGPSAPDGSQAGYLQNLSVISQTIGGWSAGTYTLDFDAAVIPGTDASQNEQLQVFIDDMPVTFSSSTSLTLGTSYSSYTSDSFTVPAGVHQIRFVGLGDSTMGTALIDQVSVSGTGAPTVLDGSFETDSLGSGNYAVNPIAYPLTATSSTGGTVAGKMSEAFLQEGQNGTPIPQESLTYYAHTAGSTTVFPLASDTVYGNTDGTDARTTLYSYTYFSGTNAIQSVTTIAPPITSSQNGPATSTSDTADADTTIGDYDPEGRLIWTKDGGGYLTYTAYDDPSGGITKSIQDVNTADTGEFASLPSGWSTPSGGGLNLITSYQVDALGRTIQESDPGAYENTVLGGGPQLYWQLDESSGTAAADASGNGNGGTYSGTYTQGQPGALAGNPDTATSFNGGNVTSSATLNDAQTTVEAWVYLKADPSGNALVAGFATSGGLYDKDLYVDSGGAINWYVYDGTSHTVTGFALPLDTWVYVVGTANGTTSCLYVDGQLVGSTSAGNTYTSYTAPDFHVGGGPNFGNVDAGIDDTAVYNSALSAAQIAAHYMAGTGSDPGTVTYTVYNDPNHENRVYPGWQSITGQATSTGTTTTLVDTALGFLPSYVGDTLLITSGANSGQSATITAYNASTHTLTLSSALTSATDSTSHFVIAGTTGPIQVTREYRPQTVVTGQATSTGSTTTLLDTTDLNSSGQYVGLELMITSGTDAGQIAIVTAYNASTHTLSFSSAFTSATDSTTHFVLNSTTDYDETLTSSAAPTINSSGLPTGSEALMSSNIQSLVRGINNDAGQMIEDVDYFSLAGLTYSQSTLYLGTASNDSSSGNYSATTYHYNARGWLDIVTDPTGTITRTVYDNLGRAVSTWVGTDDTPASGYWSPSNNTSPSNMMDVEDFYYDQRSAAPAAPTLGETTGGPYASPETLYVEITYVTAAGESEPSVVESYALTGSDLLTIASPASAAGATGYNVYLGISTPYGPDATLMMLQNSSPIAIGTNWTMGSYGVVAGPSVLGAGVGDSDLTETVQHPDTTASDDRVTLNLYDWRDRLIATKKGAMLSSGEPDPSGETDSAHRLITYTSYDNLGEETASRIYSGDEVSLDDFADWTTSTDSSDLRAYSTQSFDDQGRVYLTQTYSVDPTSGTVGSSLSTDYYYDHRDNLIDESDPGGIVTKHSYDGAGRDTKDSTTDGGVINGATQDWANAGTTANDVVIEQTLNTYDGDSNLIETEDQQRFDSDSTSSTGDLGGPTSGIYSRNYYMGYYYDPADRLIAEENVGTNGGSGWTRPSAPDARDPTHLVTTYGYDTAGNQATVMDPKGIVTQTYFDALGRTTDTIADYTDGVPTNDTNQTTTYTYDGDNNTLTMTAVMPSGTNSQTTAYLYNDTGGTVGTNLFCDDLLVKIEYPSGSTGDASTTSTDDQSYAYDNLGEQATFTDQNGTVHTYAYDVLGRLTSDTATTIGSGVESTVRRLGYSFNDAGLPFKQTSYYNTSGTSVANQVEDVYNGYGQLITQYQADAGSVTTSTTPKVQYGYTAGTNYSRLTMLTYPDGRVVDYNYDGDDLDDAISRLSSMSDSGGNIESYGYLGLSTIVREIRPGSVLTYVMADGGSTGDAGDIYIGLDRFGRVVDQLWATSDTTDGTSGDTLGTITDEFRYGYDQNSNVLYEDNMVHSADSELYHANSSASGDDSAAYDPLNRITAFRRGTLSSSDNNGSTLDTVTTASATNSWDYDALGNSAETGSTSRSFNSKNQITSYGGSSTITYDHDGNMTEDQAGNTYEYDAWNRMVFVDLPSLSSNENFTYNAGGERPGITVCNGATTTSYYSTQWQDLEDDIVVSGECGDTTTKSTYLWSEAYIDELVARDTSVNGGSVTRTFAQQKANHDVTSLVNSSGTVLERFIYDPYGNRTVLNASWSSTSDSYNWVYAFQGGRVDPLDGLISFRNRDLNPNTGTWMEQDPAGYVDGASLYQPMLDNPVKWQDPTGLATSTWGPGGPAIHPNGHFSTGYGNWFYDLRAFHDEPSVDAPYDSRIGADVDIQFWPDSKTTCCTSISIIQIVQITTNDDYRSYGDMYGGQGANWMTSSGFAVDVFANTPTPAYVGGTPSTGYSAGGVVFPAKITDQPSIRAGGPGAFLGEDVSMYFYDLAVCDGGPDAGKILGAMTWKVNLHRFWLVDGFSSVIGPQPIGGLGIPLSALNKWYQYHGTPGANPYH